MLLCWRVVSAGTRGFDVCGDLFLTALRILCRHTIHQPVKACKGRLLLQLLEAHEILVWNNDDLFIFGYGVYYMLHSSKRGAIMSSNRQAVSV